MPNLKKYIQDHRSEFDSFEPEPGHFKRFEDRLTEQPGLKSSGYRPSRLLKIAALIVILISVSVFIFEFATREIRERFAQDSQATELPIEIREVLQYYDNQASTKLATLHQLAANQDDAGAMSAAALKELNSIDVTTNELKKSLTETPGNERILDAIIQNQQMKETMLNTIITQISHSKK